MKPRRLVCLIVAASLAPAAASTDALASPSRMTDFADAGVVAVRDPGGVHTGFALGNTDLVIADTSVNTGVHLLTAGGLSTVGAYAARDGELAAFHAPELHLLPLRRSALREISAGTSAYILGAPLGYEGERIRAVRLPAVQLHSTRMVFVAGGLPRSFQGAPVVTQAGRVIGAVAAVGASSWTLAPQVRLSTLVVAAVKTNSSAGIPVISILVGVFIVIAGLGGLVAMRTRRRRVSTERTPVVVRQRPVRRPTHRPIEDPTQRSTQPLVRRRESAVDHDDDEDFNVILKSQNDK
jgi:hypothetical protein